MGGLPDVFGNWGSRHAPEISGMVRSSGSRHMAMGLVAHVTVLRSRDPELCFCAADWTRDHGAVGCHISLEMQRADCSCSRGCADFFTAERIWVELSAADQGGAKCGLVFLL